MRRVRVAVTVVVGVAGTLLAGIAAAGPTSASTSALFADQYKLIVVNQSGSPTDIAVYQVDPGFSAAAVPLVWQAAPLTTNAETSLAWNSDYSVSWSKSTDLKPGAVYHPVQTLPVAPGVPRKDGADLKDSDGALGLHPVVSPAQAGGTLTLEEPRTIPNGDASVALGVAGRPASVVKAEPNRTLHFTPHPNYWITAGTFTEGEVINPRTVSNPLHLRFEGKGTITVTLHPGGRWTIS